LEKASIDIGESKSFKAELALEYMRLVLAKNQKMNLTSITDPLEFIEKHIIDSLVALDYARGDISLIDVGTGAGFPGVILKIANPSLKLALLEATKKKLAAVASMAGQLGIGPIDFYPMRAEEAAQMKGMREKYDVAIARAVARLPAHLEYLAGFVKVGGQLVAMKSGQIDAEILSAKNAAKTLGFGNIELAEAALPYSGASRKLAVYTKHAPTDRQFPRHNSLISNSPL